MERLTIERLKAMKPETVFAKGILNDPQLYSGRIKWVAVRGQMWDWTIYYHHCHYDYNYIARYGDKCFTDTVIKKLVPCNKKAFGMYRL